MKGLLTVLGTPHPEHSAFIYAAAMIRLMVKRLARA
jgi:hypothetical protein